MLTTFTRRFVRFHLAILLLLVLCVPATAYSDEELKSDVQHLIRQHYIYGLPYSDAKSLGVEATPFLFEMLNDPAEKEYWVNAVVAIGFIEDPSAFTLLMEFIESASGEVELHKFKALASVPFAIGCLASTGDQRPYDYLRRLITFSHPDAVNWRYQNINTDVFIAAEAATALAISGLNEARVELEKTIATIESGEAPPRQIEILPNLLEGLKIMNRIEEEGRAAVFNPY